MGFGSVMATPTVENGLHKACVTQEQPTCKADSYALSFRPPQRRCS